MTDSPTIVETGSATIRISARVDVEIPFDSAANPTEPDAMSEIVTALQAVAGAIASNYAQPGATVKVVPQFSALLIDPEAVDPAVWELTTPTA